ncbi:MAG: ribonuclease P protein component, partial [Alphaproteobacteria bacterium]
MIQRLKNRRQFLRVAAENRKWAAPGIVLQVAPQPPDDQAETDGPRYGLTVSKRVGNAVTRNRARRRLRAVAEDILPRAA